MYNYKCLLIIITLHIRQYQQFFFKYKMLFPRRSTSFHSLTTSFPTTYFAFVSKVFKVPSRQVRVPLKQVSLSFSFTSTGLPRSCLMKCSGLFLTTFLEFIINHYVCNYKLMIGALLQTILLFINAIAILNQKRFLKKHGFSTVPAPNSPNEQITSKSQFIMAMVTLRSIGKYFLIPLNVMAIVLQVLG